jgi:anti-sigma factor RsiW
VTCDLTGREHCAELLGRLSEYIDRELDPAVCRDIEAHIAECETCRACLQTLKQTIALCRRAEARPVPSEVSERLHAMLQRIPKSFIAP